MPTKKCKHHFGSNKKNANIVIINLFILFFNVPSFTLCLILQTNY